MPERTPDKKFIGDIMEGCGATSKVTASDIYCHGPLLHLAQTSELFKDSKTFVDMPMKADPEVILKRFNDLVKPGTPDKQKVLEFIERNFAAAGEETEPWIPDDWTESPSLLKNIRDPALRTFAATLNDLWKVLGRKMKTIGHPDRHSLIHVTQPFIIPGDRFREFYYWDTYWIVGGLLAVDMTTTVRGILQNYLHIVDRYGFVPNGGRIYYLNRSQPPLLTPMVKLYYEKTRDLDFVRDSLALLDKEHEFWIRERSVVVSSDLVPRLSRSHSVARYGAVTSSPRPEGYLDDYKLTKDMPDDVAKATLSHVISACESGWDFSTRWLGANQSMTSIRTREIAPVDLNVYLCWSEQILAEFYELVGDSDKQQRYEKYADDRKSAIDDLFWDSDLGVWFDLDLITGKHKNDFYPSNIFPLLAGCTHIDTHLEGDKILKYLKETNSTGFKGGIPTSLTNSGQQWDFPNAWSPLVHFFVDSISKLANEEAQILAKGVASNWILSNHEAWKKTGHMFEKYDARTYGASGGGGEYDVQTGFGWTNGVVLMLLDKYGGEITVQ